jgi:hypothetical protein
MLLAAAATLVGLGLFVFLMVPRCRWFRLAPGTRSARRLRRQLPSLVTDVAADSDGQVLPVGQVDADGVAVVLRVGNQERRVHLSGGVVF